jgi:hypothetical protein
VVAVEEGEEEKVVVDDRRVMNEIVPPRCEMPQMLSVLLPPEAE